MHGCSGQKPSKVKALKLRLLSDLLKEGLGFGDSRMGVLSEPLTDVSINFYCTDLLLP